MRFWTSSSQRCPIWLWSSSRFDTKYISRKKNNLKPLQDEHPASTAALEVLEEIDDDLDEQGIVFVKLDDEVFHLNYTGNSYIRDFE